MLQVAPASGRFELTAAAQLLRKLLPDASTISAPPPLSLFIRASH